MVGNVADDQRASGQAVFGSLGAAGDDPAGQRGLPRDLDRVAAAARRNRRLPPEPPGRRAVMFAPPESIEAWRGCSPEEHEQTCAWWRHVQARREG